MMQAVPPVQPGLYLGSGMASLLRANCQQYLFNNQAIVSGQASIAVQLERIKSSFYPWGVSFEISFSGNPGTFDIEAQTSDIDEDSKFVTIVTLNSGLNSSNVGRIELALFWAKYVRIYASTITNPVKLTVLATH